MTDKITISGTVPKFDQAELEQRITSRHNQYHQTSESYEIVRGAIPHLFLSNVIAKHDQGYKLMPSYPMSVGQLSYEVGMTKPDEMQKADLDVIDAQVKQAYITELEVKRDKFKQLMVDQLLQTAELKEQKKVDDAKAKRLVEIQKQVNETFADLVVPD
jgi:hypothetical protein